MLPDESHDVHTRATRVQEGMLSVEGTLTGRPSPFHVLTSAEITGPLDTGRLTVALARVVRRNSALRTVFTRDADTGMVGRRVARSRGPKVIEQELPPQPPGTDVVGLAERLISPLAPQLLRPYAEPPLVFVLTAAGPERTVLSVLAHHVLLDGWSYGLLWEQIAEGYADGDPADAEAPGMEVFVAAERTGVAPEAVAARAALLEGWPTVVELPGDLERPQTRAFTGARVPFLLTEAARTGCVELASTLKVSRNVVLLAAWALTVARRAGQNRLVVGVPTNGRTSRTTMQVIGGATGLTPIACETPAEASVADYIRLTARALRDTFRHGDVPFEDIATALSTGADPARNPLAQIVFAAQNDVLPATLTAGDVRFSIRIGHTGGTMYDAMLHVMSWDPVAALELEYATTVLTPGEATSLAGGFDRALVDMAADPEGPLAAITTVTGAQRRLLDQWEQGTGTEPTEGLWQLIEAAAERRPDTVAVRDGDPDRTVTYRRLMAAVTAQSALLSEAGVREGDRVALVAPRSIEEIIAVLAILRTGAAYVGIDSGSPARTTSSILERAGVRVILGTADGLAALGPATEGRIAMAVVDPADPPRTGLAPAAAPADPERAAYVAFTSGTTGVPKGAMVPCRGVVRLALDTELFPAGAYERYVRLAPLAFDASTIEIFYPLLAGGTIEVHPDPHVTPNALATFLERREVTGMFLTSGLFRLVADFRPDAFRGLVQLMTGGDVISPPHVAAIVRACPGIRVTNGYGPTENTTITAAHHIDDLTGVTGGALPIGRPILGTGIKILDGTGRPVPPGGIGELVAFGEGVALGYVGMPDETARAFGTDDDGRLFYRTGDLARWDADGNLRFHGRRDSQVKVRGFRIEPDSVARLLRQHPEVHDATVAVVSVGNGDKQILAAVTPQGVTPQAAALRAFVSRTLPAYSVPHLWTVVDELPMTKNGKIDIAALTAGAAPVGTAATPPEQAAHPGRVLEEKDQQQAQAQELPCTGVASMEDIIAQAWHEVLGHRDFGPDDWFLDVGGDSLSLVRVHTILDNALPDRRLTVADLYAFSTISELAALLRADDHALST